MTTGDFAGGRGVFCSCCSAGVGRVAWPSVGGWVWGSQSLRLTSVSCPTF